VIVDTGARIDLVLSDQAMPGMTGAELHDAIRARRPHLPFVLATGFAELPASIGNRLRRLAKPFTQRELANAIADAAH
jgi:CheY-like chemotaxis protein